MGIRKKISFGFLALALLLLFSGLVSLFELNKMGRDTQNILELSSQNMELSKRMLDAIQDQSSSLLQTIVLHQTSYDSLFLKAQAEFNMAFIEIESITENPNELDSIYAAKNRYFHLVGEYFDENIYTDIQWFTKMYRSSYSDLSNAIKDYMMTSQHSLQYRAEELKSSAYRATAPGVISLAVAIIIVLLFAFFIDTYFTKPILGIKKGLDNYLDRNIPFNVKMEGDDEIFDLKERITDLINRVKNR